MLGTAKFGGYILNNVKIWGLECSGLTNINMVTNCVLKQMICIIKIKLFNVSF